MPRGRKACFRIGPAGTQTRMANPQQPELRRSAKGATTEDSADLKAGAGPAGGQPHGTDQGAKGGGEGGGVPPDQQSPYPQS